MKNKISLLILISVHNFLNAQTNFNTSWVCGSNGMKASFVGDNVFTYPYVAIGYYFTGGGNSNICDSSGRLILLSDGMNIFDSTLHFIENGKKLLSEAYYNASDGFSDFSQTSIFLPFDDSIYYLITPDVTDSLYNTWYSEPYGDSPFNRLLYHKIDMKANGGKGKVIEKAVPMLENAKLSKSQMMACKHANGKDWWLVKQWCQENKIVKFLIKKDSISGPYYQTLKGTFSKYDRIGQSMFSQDGSKYATTSEGTNKIFLADFDRCSGDFSKPVWYNVPNYHWAYGNQYDSIDIWTHGLTFSPNGRFLFVMKSTSILQLDLWDKDSSTAWYYVAGVDRVSNKQWYGNSYLGKNDKLYIGYWTCGGTMELSVIDAPDNKGNSCDFCPRCLPFRPTLGSTTNPPCMPNYDLGALDCNSQYNRKGHVTDIQTLLVYPNPTSDVLILESMALKDKENEIALYNVMGQLVYHKKIFTNTTTISLDISDFSKGIYFLKTGSFKKRILKE